MQNPHKRQGQKQKLKGQRELCGILLSKSLNTQNQANAVMELKCGLTKSPH